MLAATTGHPPADLTFTTTGNGKPVLAGGPEFSLAHSGRLALVAISAEAPVGVDVELMRTGVSDVARFFATEEQDELAALSGTARDRRFFEMWTEKEAYRKATGEGIAAPGALLRVPAAGWVLHRPAVPAPYLAAVAVLAAEASFAVREDAASTSSH